MTKLAWVLIGAVIFAGIEFTATALGYQRWAVVLCDSIFGR